MWKNIKIFQNKKTDSLNREDTPLYKALTPTEEVENSHGYFSALKWALENDDVRNIAISGPYGSGKSSVLESFFKNNYKNQKDVLRISLAAFNLDGDVGKGSPNNPSRIKDSLQAEILKQLFFSVEPDKIPKSKYKKLKTESRFVTKIEAIVFIVLICTGLALFSAPIQIILEHVEASKNVIPYIIYLIVCGVIACYILFKILEWLKRIGSIRLKIKLFGNEIEANQEPDPVFNKNMHEIVYFFEQTKKKIVVFEDLDRFNNTDILVSLRDLNYILNNRDKRGKRSVKFIYAIKDDMFLEKGERTKFFDFIIPIIPYISSTNSGEILRKRLELDENTNKSKMSDISGEFISMISPYIDDMRDLTCICNEFLLYKETLKKNQDLDLNDEKMFALMVFKNLYPKDFAELEDEKPEGIVKQAFDSKRSLTENQASMIKKKQQEENDKIKEIKKECLMSIKELKLCLINCLTQFQHSVSEIVLNGATKQLSDLLDDGFDINSLKEGRIVVKFVPNPYSLPNIQIDNIEKIVQENGNYFTRIDRLKEGLKKAEETSRKTIEEYEAEIRSLNTSPINVLIKKYGTISLGDCVCQNRLLVFLLRNGYIDETYTDYINYFHPNSITKEEKNFILGVRNHQTENTICTIKHAGRIFEELQDQEFMQKEILNVDLIDYVLENRIESSRAKMLMMNLSDHSEDSMRFIKTYLEGGKNADIFIQHLCKANPLFWRDVEQDNGLSLETKYRYLELMLQSMSMDDIFKQDSEIEGKEVGWISNFMLSQPGSLEGISGVFVEKQKEFIERLNISFDNVEIDSLDESVKQLIFNGWYFELNPVMLERIFKWKASRLVEEQRRKNYSCIQQLGEKELLDYVHKYFSDYINQVVLGMESNTEEDKEAVEDIIGRLQDNADLCLKVLDKEHIIWDDINECCAGFGDDSKETKKKIWDHIFDLGQVKCSWNNIEAYYEQFGHISSLEKYIEKNIEIVTEQFDPDQVSDNLIQELYHLNISEQNFEKLMQVLRDNSCTYNGDLNGFSAEKIRIMINEYVLPFTEEYWKALESKKECRICFAENCKEDFIQIIDALHLEVEELCALLRSNKFNEDEKLKLVKLLKSDDLSKENVALTLASLEFLIPKEYSDAVWRVLDSEGKKMLLLNQMENCPDQELSELFMSLPEEYHSLSDRSSNHKVKLKHTEYNQRLLEKLKSKGYTTNWSVTNDDRGEGRLLSAKVKKCAEQDGNVKRRGPVTAS